MQNCIMSVWECPRGAEMKEILFQTSKIPDPNMRAVLTKKMLGQREQELHAAALHHVPAAASSVKRARSGSGARQCPSGAKVASRPSSARRPNSARSVDRCPANQERPVRRPRPQSAHCGGRWARARPVEGLQTPRTPRSPARANVASCSDSGTRQWLPHWIDPSDWAEILAMERRSPTRVRAGRQEWSGKPPCYASFDRPWSSSMPGRPGGRAAVPHKTPCHGR